MYLGVGKLGFFYTALAILLASTNLPIPVTIPGRIKISIQVFVIVPVTVGASYNGDVM